MDRFAVSLAKGDVARFAPARENAQWKRISDVCGRDAAVPRRVQRADAKFWSAGPKYRLAARSDDVANLWLPACQCIEEFVSRRDLSAGIARIGSGLRAEEGHWPTTKQGKLSPNRWARPIG